MLVDKILEMEKNMRKPVGIMILFLLIGLFACQPNGEIQAKGNTQSVVMQRLQAVRKDFPNQSRINAWITVNGFSGGGCNALVMYTTLKIFHNAYVPSEDTYKQVGKTVSTKSNKAMKRLFENAKPGDVIRWRKGYTDSHFAIFLTGSTKGIYVYEANFGSRNKVWYRHFWAWKNMRKWPKGGASKVNIYRSKNYNLVNKKKAAVNYKKGDEIVVKGLRYRVTKAGTITGTVKFVGYDLGTKKEGKKIPKYLYVNKDTGDDINSNVGSSGGQSKKPGRNAQIVYKVKK